VHSLHNGHDILETTRERCDYDDRPPRGFETETSMVQQLTAPTAQDERTGTHVTYEEFRAKYPDDVRAEWVDGDVILLMSPEEVQQDIVVFLPPVLNFFVRVFDPGKISSAPFEMRLRDGKSYREPDLLFVSKRHLERLDSKRLDNAADLVIEIVSDEIFARDRRDKFVEYAASGIQEYWLLDPRPNKKEVICWSLTPEGNTFHSM